MTQDRFDELRALVADSPFYRWSGMTLAEVDGGSVTVALDLADHHLNLQGLAHGGVIATLADAAMGLSLRSALEPGRRHVSLEIGVHYLRPVTRAVFARWGGRCGSGVRSPTPRPTCWMRTTGCSPVLTAPTA